MTDDVKKVVVGEMCILNGQLWEFVEGDWVGCIRAIGYRQSDSELVIDEIRETTLEKMIAFFKDEKEVKISF
jgi:hypothetical protein